MRRGVVVWSKVEVVVVFWDVEKMVRWNMRWRWGEKREGVRFWVMLVWVDW